MRNIIAFLVAFFALFALSFASDCELNGHKFNKGETFHPPDECTEITCNGRNNVSKKGCPYVASLKPCKYIPEDRTKTYPECCARFEC